MSFSSSLFVFSSILDVAGYSHLRITCYELVSITPFILYMFLKPFCSIWMVLQKSYLVKIKFWIRYDNVVTKVGKCSIWNKS
jgi:hypothetical protein